MGLDYEHGGSELPLQTPPREDTPLLSSSQHLSSQSKTFANVFIAIVGSGVLGLPYTFKKTGWVLGAATILAVAAVTYHCMMLLVRTRRKLESSSDCRRRHTSLTIASFGDLGFAVGGVIGRAAVDAMIVLSQVGFCVAYLLFIAHTLAFMFNSSPADPTNNTKILGFLSPKLFYVWSCFPFQLGLNSIPTLTHLAPLSIFADVVDLGAMGVVMVEDMAIFLRDRPPLQAFGGLSVFFYGLGVAVYSFEGVGMVLPLESEARDKEKFSKTLGFSMAFISLMYALFGALGYFAFGQETKEIITTNLGKGAVSSLVQLGLCVNLFFTFPLMMNPVYEVVERRFCEGRYCMWVRWAVVLGVSLVALLVPNFADFLSLVGSSVCCVLIFVFPATFHWMVFKKELKWRAMVSDGLIVALGVIVAVSGTWLSLMEIFAVKD